MPCVGMITASGGFDCRSRRHLQKPFSSVLKCSCDFLEVFEILCDPGSRPTVILASSALCFWQQFTEIPRLRCPWHTHPCRTRLRGNRWRALWCCRIKALNPVPAISVAGAEFIVCDTKLAADTYLVRQIFVNVKHISVWKPWIVRTSDVIAPRRSKFDFSTRTDSGRRLMRQVIPRLPDVSPCSRLVFPTAATSDLARTHLSRSRVSHSHAVKRSGHSRTCEMEASAHFSATRGPSPCCHSLT